MLFLLQGGDPCLLKVEDGLVIIMSFSIELHSVPPNVLIDLESVFVAFLLSLSILISVNVVVARSLLAALLGKTILDMQHFTWKTDDLMENGSTGTHTEAQ